MSKVQLKDCIEPLLKFTLALSIEESIDTGLSKEFCCNLLKEDDHDRTYTSSTSSTEFSDRFEGVPFYPLYKHLASALLKSISSGAIQKMHTETPLIHEDSSLKQKECEWNEAIRVKGSDLVKMLETLDFELHVQEPFFTQLKDGHKTVEGRCAGGVNRFESGSLILFNKCLLLQVQDVHWYASFSDMLAAEGLSKVLPGIETIKEGVQVYRKFYSEEREMSNGVLAILVKPTSQIYDHLAAILAALSYDGIQRLLGISHTIGTIPDALPLPRSTLLSAFSSPYNPDTTAHHHIKDIQIRPIYVIIFLLFACSLLSEKLIYPWLEVKSSVLSDGARALAKHVNRSKGKFWGSFSGNDPHKNMLALNVINHLIAHCCWLNVHIVPPHGPVFEIRVQDGYGARWSLNTTKFIGFLEPYMEDGHARGWKH